MKKLSKETIELVFYDPSKKYSESLNFVVPNMASFVRDVTAYGNIGAMIRRAVKLNFIQLIKIAWWNKLNVLKLLKKDFACGVVILTQMEVLQILKYKPGMIALTDQVSDLAIALKNYRILRDFIQTVKSLSINPGIVTNNLIQANQALVKVGGSGMAIITPFNTDGYEMNPSQKEIEAMMKMLNPSNIYAIVPSNTKEQDKYLTKFGITKKVTKWF